MSIFSFGIYLVLSGLVLLIVPNMLLALFHAPGTNEVWIRVAGVLTVNIGFLNIMAARAAFRPFYYWMFPTRSLFIVSMTAFVLLKVFPVVFILFGGMDLLGMLWTYFASESPGGNQTGARGLVVKLPAEGFPAR